MLLLHVDGNLNLYVNVIQQTGYHHQSYFFNTYNTAELCQPGCADCYTNIHLFKLLYIMKITVNFVYPIGFSIIIIGSEWY